MASATPDCARNHERASIGMAAAVLIAVALGGCSARTFHTPAGVQPARSEFRGEHYVVICHFDCGPAGRGALEAAEAAWRQAIQLMGPARQPLDRPLSIHIYGTYQEYEIVEMELTHGQFRGNRAMTHPATLSAHLATHPYLAAPVLREFGLTTNTLRVVAHEALHLAALAAHPKSRWLPTWLEEGLATWTETQVLVELDRAPNITEEPVSSTRASLLRQHVERGSLPHLRDLLVSAEISLLALADQYAFYQYFFDFLKTRHGANLTQQLYAVDDTEGRGDSYTRRVTESLLGTGNGTVDRLNGEFRAYANELRPTWLETRRTFSAMPNAWVQVGFDDGAQIWRWEPVLEPPAELSGRAQIFDGADASVLLALQDGGFISVTLRASGGLTIVQHGPFGVAPRILAERSSAARSSDPSFRIRIERDGLAVWVTEAAEPLRLVGTGMRPTGRWGLAVSPRGNVVWRNVQNTRVE